MASNNPRPPTRGQTLLDIPWSDHNCRWTTTQRWQDYCSCEGKKRNTWANTSWSPGYPKVSSASKINCIFAWTLWWVKTLVSSCTIYLKYSPANYKGSKSIGAPLGHEAPTALWTKLSSDIFTFDKKNYLLIIDYMSHIPVICMLQSMTATHVTEHMKAIFSEYGIPKSIVTDNGPCYSSEYFKKMMKKMAIHQITTSPHHHQSNGLAEGYVKIIKSLLQKAKETGDDPHAVTLIYHSTPLSDTLPSPFEMIHGQKPISDLSQIQYNSTITSNTFHTKDKQQENVDENILPIGTKVVCITSPGKNWHSATVEEYLGYCSFKIKADYGATYVRTRLHLKPYKPCTQLTPKQQATQEQPALPMMHWVLTSGRKVPTCMDL